eukprot:NODE_4676_length_777_cov_7.196429_g4332_i0.p2 GENE.NODE_4676_length_777_cov_7.196429_g4332_i0~~NODE_4676_length_777_cov_7.196429_g4332_i0.p2  ORF type:complete len:161 (-),score=31.90 NODE_4676_length_777_cov_7.196429_g4332_i0:197-679(-)
MVQIEPPSDVDNAEWRRIHSEKPRLDSFPKGDMLISGSVWKRGMPTMFGGPKWANRYVIMSKKFLIYFASDSPDEKALGCVYISHCGVEKIPSFEGKSNVVKLMPRVPRKPGATIAGDAPYFWFSLDSESYGKWIEHFERAYVTEQTKHQKAYTDGNIDA